MIEKIITSKKKVREKENQRNDGRKTTREKLEVPTRGMQRI